MRLRAALLQEIEKLRCTLRLGIKGKNQLVTHHANRKQGYSTRQAMHTCLQVPHSTLSTARRL
jgi:hypothetical protein